MSDDSRWIDETLAGQRSSYEFLVVKYQDRLFNSVFQVVGRREEAEDVVQEAFVQAFVKLGTFQRTSGFYTWIYRIAFNLSVSRRRKKRPEHSIDHLRDQAGEEPIARNDPIGQELERKEDEAELYVALDELSDEHRKIVVLRELEGLCYEEIAEVLDLPVGTVRSRLHRARLQLKEFLQTNRSEK